MTYSIVLTVTNAATFAVSNFVMPPYEGGFNRNEFWKAFIAEHHAATETALLTLLLDLARCHWSPKHSNWPGMRIVITKQDSSTIQIDLPAGKTETKPFKRGKGKTYSWTRACLATAGIFEQVYRKGACDTTTMKGHWQGADQFFSTVDGFTRANYDEAAAAFRGWVSQVGLKARDSAIDTAVQTATHSAIDKRTKASSAFSLINALRFCTGVDPDEADQITFSI